MQDLNEVRITGTIFNEPKYVKTQTNGLLSRFTVAVHRKDSSKSVDFLSVIAWDDVAEFIQEHFADQSRISFVGTVQYQKYKAADGTDKRIYRIVAQNVVDPSEMGEEAC